MYCKFDTQIIIYVKSHILGIEIISTSIHVLFSHFIFEKHDNVMQHAIFIIIIILKGVKKISNIYSEHELLLATFLFLFCWTVCRRTFSKIMRKTLTIHWTILTKWLKICWVREDSKKTKKNTKIYCLLKLIPWKLFLIDKYNWYEINLELSYCLSNIYHVVRKY